MAKVCIRSLYVELCQLLGEILRSELKYPVLKVERWTFERDQSLFKVFPDRQTYHGRGCLHLDAQTSDYKFQKDGKTETIVKLQSLCDCIPTTNGNKWQMQVWIKYPNEVTTFHLYTKDVNADLTPHITHLTTPEDLYFK